MQPDCQLGSGCSYGRWSSLSLVPFDTVCLFPHNQNSDGHAEVLIVGSRSHVIVAVYIIIFGAGKYFHFWNFQANANLFFSNCSSRFVLIELEADEAVY